MLNHALKYQKMGLSVIPLEPKGKKPLVPWAEFQKRKATDVELKEWWKKWPNANIGIVTGTISGVCVVDLDGLEGLQSAQNMGLTSNCVSLTGDGKHLWYRHPGQVVENTVRMAPGIDLRGDGGYVVCAPSVHESGRRYRFVTSLNLNLLPEFPSALLVPSVSTPNVKVKEESWNKRSDNWIAQALEGMKNGNIDDTLFLICSRLRADGYSADDCRILLQPHAERVGATPGHLDEKIRNVWDRYPSGRGTTGLGRELSSIYPSTEPRSGNSGLVIHSPTNPDSVRQYEYTKLDVDTPDANLQTGYQKLDQMLKGGLKSSRLFTVAARTGVGKTNWLIGVAKSLCESGKKVLLFSTEMPYGQIWERYIASLSDREQFKRHQFFVCDSFAPNLERVEEAIKEIRPDVFMFDHINHVSEEQRELGAFMQGLNFIRRKYECAGIVTAQLNRSADWVDLKTNEKVTPRMSMIKGSGTIEQASSRVLLLSETRVLPEGTEIVGNLDKNDKGPKGLVHFMLRTNPYRMEEI